MAIAVGIIIAYILGSIPTAVWLGKALYGIDVREHGSQNPGATNTFRVLGKKAGVMVMLGDIIKGMLAASLAIPLMKMGLVSESNLIITKIVFGIVAVFGHIFSVFLNFKGGKGVATLLGMMIAIQYEVALISVAIFIVTLLLSKYVSLASIVSAFAFPVVLWFVPRFKTTEPLLILFGFILFIVILWTHHKNIRRIIDGEERKTYLIRRR